MRGLGAGAGGAWGSGRLSAGAGGARGGSRLGASRVSSSRRGARSSGGLGAGRVSRGRGGRGGARSRPRRVAVTDVDPFTNSRGRVNVVSTTSLHHTGEGGAGKSQESQSVDHFEKLKSFFLYLIARNLGNSNE